MTEVRSPALTSWVREFVAKASQDSVVSAFVARVDDAITAQIPQIAGEPVLVQDLHGSTGSQWRAFLAMLEDDYRLSLPDPAYGLTLSLARRGMDLGVLLKVYRVANQAVFTFLNEIIEAAGEGAPARDEVLVFIWERAARWMDDAVESLTETFVGERQRLHDGTVARRTETIEALLGAAPPAARDAEKVLAHPLRHWQTGCVIWAEPTDGTTTAIGDASRALSQALGGPPALTVVAGSRELWCWVATPVEPDLSVLSTLEEQLEAGGLRLAVGIPQQGVSGFRTSHAEARAVQELALDSPATPPVIRYADVELLCLTAGRPDLMRRTVVRELGALAGLDKNLGLLRETVLVHLTSPSIEASAEKLFVHKNTVRYRIARAEELLGHTLAERSTPLELALRWVRFFGLPTED